MSLMSFIQGRMIYELGEYSALLAMKSLLWGLVQESFKRLDQATRKQDMIS